MKSLSTTTIHSLFLICPFSSSEVLINNTFGEHIVFLRRKAAMFSFRDKDTIREIKRICHHHPIKKIVMVMDKRCITSRSLLIEPSTMVACDNKLLAELFAEHFLSIMEQKGLEAKLEYFHALALKRMAIELQSHPLWQELQQEQAIELIGFISNKKQQSFKQIQLPRLHYGSTLTGG